MIATAARVGLQGNWCCTKDVPGGLRLVPARESAYNLRMTTISKFPVSTWQKIWNKRGARAVNCVVSGRWLKVGEPGTSSGGYLPTGKIGTPVPIDVMTGGYDDEEPRKICSLVVTYEELKALLDKLKSETDGDSK